MYLGVMISPLVISWFFFPLISCKWCVKWIHLLKANSFNDASNTTVALCFVLSPSGIEHKLPGS